MAERTCFNCMYCICDPCLWLRWLWEGQSIVPQCANHPQWPGLLHDVPGVPCRNYRPKLVPPEGDNVRMIATIDGGYVYVDAADYEWLNRWKWCLEDGYAVRSEKGKHLFMHRVILPPPRGKVTDHIDGNRANNCRCNLRVCNHSENNRNRRKPNGASSAYKGVFYDRANHKWRAQCFYRGKPVHLGFFDTEEEAARAYDRKAVELFGEFARLNFPREWPPERRAQVHAAWQKSRKKAKVKRKKVNRKTTTPRAKPAPSAAKRGTRSDRIVKRGRVTRLVTSDVRRPTKRAAQPLDDPPASARAGTRRRRGQKRMTKSARPRAARSGRKDRM